MEGRLKVNTKGGARCGLGGTEIHRKKNFKYQSYEPVRLRSGNGKSYSNIAGQKERDEEKKRYSHGIKEERRITRKGFQDEGKVMPRLIKG